MEKSLGYEYEEEFYKAVNLANAMLSAGDLWLATKLNRLALDLIYDMQFARSVYDDEEMSAVGLWLHSLNSPQFEYLRAIISTAMTIGYTVARYHLIDHRENEQ